MGPALRLIPRLILRVDNRPRGTLILNIVDSRAIVNNVSITRKTCSYLGYTWPYIGNHDI